MPENALSLRRVKFQQLQRSIFLNRPCKVVKNAIHLGSNSLFSQSAAYSFSYFQSRCALGKLLRSAVRKSYFYSACCALTFLRCCCHFKNSQAAYKAAIAATQRQLYL